MLLPCFLRYRKTAKKYLFLFRALISKLDDLVAVGKTGRAEFFQVRRNYHIGLEQTPPGVFGGRDINGLGEDPNEALERFATGGPGFDVDDQKDVRTHRFHDICRNVI